MADFTKSTLNYPQGSPTPIRRVSYPRPPTTTDYRNFTPGDEWLDTSSQDWWKFVERSGTPSQGVWVKIGGTSAAAETFTVDAGTNPVTPDASNDIVITGAQVASGVVGANVIRTDSLSDHTITIEVQRTTTSANPDSSLNGVAHFDSTHFSVDGDGFVQLIGGEQAIDSFIPDTGISPVVPDSAGQISITGQNPPNVSGIQVTGGTNSLNLSMFSPFEGDFAFAQSNPAGAVSVKVLVVNNDNSSSASHAQFVAAVAGTSSGNPFNLWSVGSLRSYALGIDTGDSQILKLTTAGSSGGSPSTGTEIISFGNSGEITFDNAYTFPISDGSPDQVLMTDGSGSISFETVPFPYVTGTFIPTLSFGGSSTGITYSKQYGRFTRIGDLVFFNLDITLTSKGSATGNAVIDMPGVPLMNTTENTPYSVLFSFITFSSASYTYAGARGNENSTTINPFEGGSGQISNQLIDSTFANNSVIEISGCYHTDD